MRRSGGGRMRVQPQEMPLACPGDACVSHYIASPSACSAEEHASHRRPCWRGRNGSRVQFRSRLCGARWQSVLLDRGNFAALVVVRSRSIRRTSRRDSGAVTFAPGPASLEDPSTSLRSSQDDKTKSTGPKLHGGGDREHLAKPKEQLTKGGGLGLTPHGSPTCPPTAHRSAIAWTL